jgi:tetratricopeptide (TPR) repeat protein
MEISSKAASRLTREFQVGICKAALTARPTELGPLQLLGEALTALGRHHEALEIDRRITTVIPDSPLAQYNLACSFSNLGLIDDSIAALGRAIDLGYDDLNHMLQDPDLARTRTDDRFAALADRLRGTGGS